MNPRSFRTLPRETPSLQPSRSRGFFLIRAPKGSDFHQALDLFFFCAAVGILFNTFHPSGIELKTRNDIPAWRPVAQGAPAYPGWKSNPPAGETPSHRKGSPPGEEAAASFPRLSLIGAKARFDKKSAAFVDARSPEEYEKGHIPGAYSLHAEEFETFAPQVLPFLRPDQEIIAYCSGTSCELSLHLAEKLQAAGYTNVKVFFGGFPEWEKAGYPVTKGAQP